VEAVKRDIPDFDGAILVSDFVGEEVKKSLARLLQEKKIAGDDQKLTVDVAIKFER